MLQNGQTAPDFVLPDQNGETLALSSLRGNTVVLFFYPKADTPGCTTEACSFRDDIALFESASTIVLGISPNTSRQQKKFADKFGLPYKLLADADHAVAEAYGVWVEKSMYGKKYMGVDRTTFVIAPDGSIAHMFCKVKVENHASEVLEFFRS